MLQEVVPAAESAKSGLHFALRLSIPAFITPRLPDDARAAPHFEWSIATAAEGEIVATLRNSGSKHLQLINLIIEDVADQAPLARRDEMAYVLAGQASSFALKAAATLPPLGTSLTIKAATDAGDQLTRAALTKP